MAEPGWRAMPGAEVAEDFLDDAGVVNDGDYSHRILADGTTEPVHVPDPEDEVAPAFGGQFGRRRRRETGAVNHQLWGQATVAHAAHFVGVPLADLDPFGRQKPFLDQQVNDLGTEEFLQGAEGRLGQGKEVEG